MWSVSVLRFVQLFFAFNVSVVMAGGVGLWLYHIQFPIGLAALPIVLLISYLIAVGLGIPALWIASMKSNLSFASFLILAGFVGLISVLIWVVWELHSGTPLAKLVIPLKTSGWIPPLAAVVGAFGYWFMADLSVHTKP
jgi:hypothetical protein